MGWQFSLVIGIVFSTLAAGTSFLITYEEYSHHIMLSKRQVLGYALRTAAVSWVFFVLLAVVVGFWIDAIVQGTPSSYSVGSR